MDLSISISLSISIVYIYIIYIYIYVYIYKYIYILYILSDTKDWCFTSGLCRWLQEADASGISLNANLVCCVRAFVCGQHGHDIGSKWLKLYDTLRSWRSMHQKMYPCIQNTYWTIHDHIILCVILYLIILKCLLSSLSYCILLSDILPHGLVHHTSEAIDVCLRNRKAEEGFRWLERIQDQPLEIWEGQDQGEIKRRWAQRLRQCPSDKGWTECVFLCWPMLTRNKQHCSVMYCSAIECNPRWDTIVYTGMYGFVRAHPSTSYQSKLPWHQALEGPWKGFVGVLKVTSYNLQQRVEDALHQEVFSHTAEGVKTNRHSVSICVN